ncbi:phosphatase PAP2 family protein [Amycolatopsis sp. FDAARGOS 1241]|uniref:phosphatase PAP2 family protein n=1 Tax=Amycolatopsis sp. FDAARGOS 1241 TaxID=2778070 RepID=UPI0019523A87|nr:phosphatase PAP2 family protein [Amycolatopsis sp. FDAARGOS 1241]QRP44237.1 phosphatase PAP2 family protein [Amycolatopsis sp. FDAARGOS 1241]
MIVPRVRWVVTGVVLLAAFVALGLLVDRQPLRLDVEVATALRGQDTRPAGLVAGVVTNVLGPVLPWVLGVVLVAFALRDRARLSVYARLAAVLVLCRVMSVVFKPAFLRQRPRAYPELSYPSGHVVSVAATGLVVVLLCGWAARRFVRLATFVAAAATVLAAVCRIVLGVHWVTDTVGAVLAVLGMGLVSATALRLLPFPDADGRSLVG